MYAKGSGCMADRPWRSRRTLFSYSSYSPGIEPGTANDSDPEGESVAEGVARGVSGRGDGALPDHQEENLNFLSAGP